MRIAVVTPEFPPITIGGGGVVVEALVREFGRAHQVAVFSADHADPGWFAPSVQDLDEGGATSIRRYPLVPLGRSKDALRTVLPPNPRAIAALFQDLSRYRADIAHLHGCGYAIVDLAAQKLCSLNVPYLLTDHGLPQSPLHSSSPTRQVYGAYERLVLSRTVARAAAFSAVSRHEADLCAQRTGRRPVIVPNGVDLPAPLPSPSDQLLAVLAQHAGRPVIAAAGRLTSSKGFDVLARAVGSGVDPAAVCLIAGSTPDTSYERDLRALCDQRTFLLGPLDRADVLALFRRAAVVAVPSRHEPFGLIGLEAIACGPRVVASEVGGLREFLSPPLARFVTPDDVPALSDALNEGLRAGPLAESERTRAGDLVREHSWPHISSAYLRILSSLRGAGCLRAADG